MVYRLLILLFVLEGCASGKLLNPEKTTQPEIPDIYKTAYDVEKYNPQKYEANQDVVRGDLIPGQTVNLNPDILAHSLSRAHQLQTSKTQALAQQPPAVEKKKPNSRVIYSGNELIRDNEINKKTGQSQVVVSIRGRALVRYEQMSMRSAGIRIVGADGDHVISDTPVTIEDHKSNTILRAGYGEFNRLQNRAYFKKSPSVVQYNKKSGEKTTITGDEMDRYFSTSVTRSYGHVVVNYSQASAYAAHLVYYEIEDRIELDGNPAIYEKQNIYTADRMTLYKDRKVAVLEGNVRVLVTQEKKDASDSRQLQTLITGDYAEYHYGSVVKTVEFKSVRQNSFVYAARKDTDTYCRRMIARGEQLDEVELFEDIYILDKENRTRLYGEYGNYSRKDHRSKVFTREDVHGNPVRPVIVFFNKKDVITGKMTSEILDRDLEKKMTYARGSVEFQLYEKADNPDLAPSLQNLLHGEWSEMDDLKKEIYLLGHPYIQNDQSKIFAAQIIIYPDQNRLELMNSVKGIFAN